ncbi:MAG: hypothetical protein R3230_00555 [Nitrosopumilaceae archaeon]|nr:hypothetical protein [Nitrosopumilaceae archaeon]
MSVTEQIEIVIPSSEEHRKDIFQKIQEMSNAESRIESEKEFIKETKKWIKETYDIEPKWISKALKDYHKNKFDETVHEFEEYEAFYESIVNMKNNATSSQEE